MRVRQGIANLFLTFGFVVVVSINTAYWQQSESSEQRKTSEFFQASVTHFGLHMLWDGKAGLSSGRFLIRSPWKLLHTTSRGKSRAWIGHTILTISVDVQCDFFYPVVKAFRIGCTCTVKPLLLEPCLLSFCQLVSESCCLPPS